VAAYRNDEYMSMLHLNDTRADDLKMIQDAHYSQVKVKKLGDFICDYVTTFMPQYHQR
jgi:hypothetical protein